MGRFEQIGAALDKVEKELLTAENALLALRQDKPTREEALRVTLREFAVTEEQASSYSAAVRTLHEQKHGEELIVRYGTVLRRLCNGELRLPMLNSQFSRVFLTEDHARVMSDTIQYGPTLLQVTIGAIWDVTVGMLPDDPAQRQRIEVYRTTAFGRVSDWPAHQKKIAELAAAVPRVREQRDNARADLEALQSAVNARVGARR